MTPDWENWGEWEPLRFFEEELSQPEYAGVVQSDFFRRRGEFETALKLLQEVRTDARRRPDPALEASSYLHEAEVHRVQGNWAEAIQAYKSAWYYMATQTHNFGAISMMLALCCQAEGRNRQALSYLENAAKQWEELWRQNRERGNRVGAQKYRMLCEHAILLLRQAQVLSKPAQEEQRAASDTTPPTPRPPFARGSYDHFSRNGHGVELIPVFETSLAAGSGVWMPESDSVEGYLEVTTLAFRGNEFHVVGLNGHGGLRLQPGYRYGCVQVQGDSMDREDICPGDFVILRVPVGLTYQPRNRDIVAVARDDDGERLGLLKRYMNDGRRVWLEPSSHNPVHERVPLGGGMVPDFIGKAVAVLKRKGAAAS